MPHLLPQPICIQKCPISVLLCQSSEGSLKNALLLPSSSSSFLLPTPLNFHTSWRSALVNKQKCIKISDTLLGSRYLHLATFLQYLAISLYLYICFYFFGHCLKRSIKWFWQLKKLRDALQGRRIFTSRYILAIYISIYLYFYISIYLYIYISIYLYIYISTYI